MTTTADWTYAKISREAKRMTGERAGSESHQAACVIIAGILVGARARAVAKKLGVELKDIRRYTSALRSSGVWRNGKTLSGVTDGVGFNIAVCCALGLMRVVPAKKGSIHDR